MEFLQEKAVQRGQYYQKISGQWRFKGGQEEKVKEEKEAFPWGSKEEKGKENIWAGGSIWRPGDAILFWNRLERQP